MLKYLSWLQKVPIASGLWLTQEAGYNGQKVRRDILAGLTVGTVAVPLSMALAIATGVPPQYGLYTAMIAGFIISLTGGTRFNISGPTAAFIVILLPIVQQYGVGGLLLASVMSGVILLALGLFKMGRLISFVPYPVVLGFTTGIAVVIASLQIPDFLGLTLTEENSHFIENMIHLVVQLPTISWHEVGIGLFSLFIMVIWARKNLPLPAPLMGLVLGTLAGVLINAGYLGADLEGTVNTINSRFSWVSGDMSGDGIPPFLPSFTMPWLFPGANGEPLVVHFDLFRKLMGPAFAIAILAAIESLLCAVIADGLTKSKHDPNAELVGQGLGNIITPFFGGITATAAIARTATSIKSGAYSPLAGMVHSVVVLLAILIFAKWLGYVPMATLAALLLIVAWNMSEAKVFARMIKTAPKGDIIVLLVCFGLTVIFDMVIAVGVGIGIAAILFIKRMADYTHTVHVDDHEIIQQLPRRVRLFDINGPLFFGAAEQALKTIEQTSPQVQIIILDMSDVSSIDASAIRILKNIIADRNAQDTAVILVGLSTKHILKLKRAGLKKVEQQLSYAHDIQQAAKFALYWCGKIERKEPCAGNVMIG